MRLLVSPVEKIVRKYLQLSEDWVGDATRYGDGAGDFSPLCNLTVTEVKEIGKADAGI